MGRREGRVNNNKGRGVRIKKRWHEKAKKREREREQRRESGT